MIVTFLGTGTSQGVPIIACHCEVCRSLAFQDKRLRASIHIMVEGKSIIIDAGPDFREQVLRERIETLDAILFTHEHKDHTAGLDDVRGFNFKQNKEIPIYGRKHVIEQLKREFAYIFAKAKYPGIPRIQENVIENKPFKIDGISVIPVEGLHFKLPVFGFRIKDLTYLTDVNHISGEEKDKIRGSKVLILNALQKETHLSHFNLAEAVDVVNELNPEKAYLTHISHRMGLHKEVNKELPENVWLGYDGLKIEI